MAGYFDVRYSHGNETLLTYARADKSAAFFVLSVFRLQIYYRGSCEPSSGTCRKSVTCAHAWNDVPDVVCLEAALRTRH